MARFGTRQTAQRAMHARMMSSRAMSPRGFDSAAGGVTQDGPGDYYVPTSVADFNALALPRPISAWGFQEAAGTIVDLVGGGFNLQDTGTVGYRAVVAGWSRFAATVAAGAGNGFRRGVGDFNPSTTSYLWMAYVDCTAGGGTAREIICGTDAAGATEYAAGHSAANVLQGKSGANLANGTADIQTGGARLIGLQLDRANSAVRAFNDADIVTPVYVAPADGNKGFGAGVRVAPAMSILWGCIFEGTDAEVDVATLRSYCTKLNVTPAW